MVAFLIQLLLNSLRRIYLSEPRDELGGFAMVVLGLLILCRPDRRRFFIRYET